MTRDSIIQALAAAVLGVSLLTSEALAPRLSNSAARHRLVYTDTAERGAPPEVALGIAMGAFRGIFVNYLWMRANTLKEAGKFYEAVQLSDAITKLQPRFPRVWVFHAWNMAYNISVTTQTREERWKWVNNGIALLRNKAIPANPNDMLLHKELAWFFQHKVGGSTDDANGYYKRKLAEEWTIALGPPPKHDANVRDRDTAIRRYVDWLMPIVEAPDDLEEVIRQDPSVGELVSHLRDEVGEDLGFYTLRRYELARAAHGSLRASLTANTQGPKSAAMWRLVEDSRFAKAWEKLLPHLRRRLLIDTYHMEPERMVRYIREYGPLDWRIAAAHALYWSARGVENSQFRWTDENKQDFDFINADRVTIQSVQDLARYGELYFDFLGFANTGRALFLSVPNTHFIQTYGDKLGQMVDRSWADTQKRAYSFYSAGYENFLRDHIRFYWRRGQRDKAEELYSRLRTYPAQNMNDPGRVKELGQPLEDWVANEIADQVRVNYVALQEVTGALQGAYIALLAGDDELFRTQFAYAMAFHKNYMAHQVRTNPIDSSGGRMENMPKDFRLMASQMLWAMLQTVDLDDAETIYDHAPEDLKESAYDLIRERFKEELDKNPTPDGRKFGRVFPEPPGMEQYRKLFESWKAEAEASRPPPVQQK